MSEIDPFSALESIFASAVREVDPYRMIKERLAIDGVSLAVREPDGPPLPPLDLSTFDRILVLGAGKASAGMAKAVEELLGDRVAGGVVAVKDPPPEPLKRVKVPVRLEIFDRRGRLVRALVDLPYQSAGSYEVRWDGRDAAGRVTAAGVYFAHLSAGDVVRNVRLVLLK